MQGYIPFLLLILCYLPGTGLLSARHVLDFQSAAGTPYACHVLCFIPGTGSLFHTGHRSFVCLSY